MYIESRIRIGKDRYKYISGDVEGGKVTDIKVAEFQAFIVPVKKDPTKDPETQEERKARVQAEIARDQYEKILLNEYEIQQGKGVRR